jgi:hypothetical protein
MTDRKKNLLLALPLFVLLCCCVSAIITRYTPIGVCFDLFSGKVPDEAMERFIEMLIIATLEKDYELIESVSSEEALNQLMFYQDNFPFINEDFTIKKLDDLAGTYEYGVYFANGSLNLGLYTQWPQCPDLNVTEEEIIQNIQLINVKN